MISEESITPVNESLDDSIKFLEMGEEKLYQKNIWTRQHAKKRRKKNKAQKRLTAEQELKRIPLI